MCQPATGPIRLRRHADGAVEPHRLAVEVAGLDHGHHELGIFLRSPQPLGERHRCRQRLLCLLGQARKERGVEDTRQDRVDPDPFGHEIARDRQSHSGDTRLGRGIGDLPDLPVHRRDRGRADHRPALAVFQPVERHHAGRGLGDALEGAHQIDLDGPEKQLDRQVADLARFLVAPDGLADRPDAGAADQHPFLAVRFARLRETDIDRSLVGYVHLASDAADLLGNAGAAFPV